jgi:hypothetical protein
MTTDDSSFSVPETDQPSTRWRALLLLLVVFLLGVACGVGGGGLWHRSRLQAAFANPRSVDGPAVRVLNRIESKLTRDLDLTPEKRSAVRQEIDEATRELASVRAETRENVQRISQTTIDRIEPHLPPEERPKFREKAREILAPWSLLPEPRASRSDP